MTLLIISSEKISKSSDRLKFRAAFLPGCRRADWMCDCVDVTKCTVPWHSTDSKFLRVLRWWVAHALQISGSFFPPPFVLLFFVIFLSVFKITYYFSNSLQFFSYFVLLYCCKISLEEKTTALLKNF